MTSKFPFPIVGDYSYVVRLYERFCQDAESVPADWRAYFETINSIDDREARPEDGLKALQLVSAFRSRGHLIARVNPLSATDGYAAELGETSFGLDPSTFGLADDGDLPLDLHGALGFHRTTLGALQERLRSLYCGPLSFEHDHIHDRQQQDWFESKVVEGPEAPSPPGGTPEALLSGLLAADEFERFVRARFPGKKTFGLEGAETMIPLINVLLHVAAEAGVREIIIGGMHRGRLNVLVNVMAKPAREVFAELQGYLPSEGAPGATGDVPYHLDFTTSRTLAGRPLRLSLCPHPSHLITVGAMALGRTRSKQAAGGSAARHRALCLLMHTDAAFSGQGLTAELLQLGRLPGFTTGGTIHLVVNNQIGFTTSPRNARSSRFCTDMAKGVEAPILRVNGQEPDAAARAAALAVEYRCRFGQDVVMDLVCVRRRGHNELDDPRFTQPVEYRDIDGLPSVRETFQQSLIDRGVLSRAAVDAEASRYREELDKAHADAASFRPNRPQWLTGRWTAIRPATEVQLLKPIETGVAVDRLRSIGHAITRHPPGLRLHRKVADFLDARGKAIEDGREINWATAEALALASLLVEGTPVRLTGQDSVRGTFAQRHLALHDQIDGTTILPLNTIADGQATIEAIDSPLSEYAVLGFEFGHSLTDPNRLNVWEAQFGDFANVAQVVIDQLIAAAEPKWQRMSGLVLLLPHGLEGGGPEHASARPERFLQLCANGNMQVVNCSTPANYFHVLRRQVRAPWRKPLVVFTPKLLLRHRSAVSTLFEMGPGKAFRPVICEPSPRDSPAVRRLVLCSGRLFYELQDSMHERGSDDTTIIRVEQLYPFPEQELSRAVARYPRTKMVWAQEEPRNYGAWSYLEPRLRAILRDQKGVAADPIYVGRPPQAAPACGSAARLESELRKIVSEVLSV
jgi:2-oxoglutarate dehydrogenase E1 component